MGLRAIQPPLAYWKKLSQALQVVSRSETSKPWAAAEAGVAAGFWARPRVAASESRG